MNRGLAQKITSRDNKSVVVNICAFGYSYDIFIISVMCMRTKCVRSEYMCKCIFLVGLECLHVLSVP